jgi:sugar O-acyltransferase (sialic acid O-acetyltransferase NeuD family)
MEREPIFILGGGGHASDVLNVIERVGLLADVAGCHDDRADLPRMQRWGIPHLGPLAGRRLERGRFVLGVGLPATKSKVLDAVDPGVATPLTLVDPGAMVGHGVVLGEGTVVFPGGCVSALVSLGSHSLVGHNGVVGHNTVLGARCSVMPGAAVSGDCEIGDDVLIGANAVVVQGISIGSGATVGAGAVVTRDVAPDVTVFGVPAKPVTDR